MDTEKEAMTLLALFLGWSSDRQIILCHDLRAEEADTPDFVPLEHSDVISHLDVFVRQLADANKD